MQKIDRSFVAAVVAVAAAFAIVLGLGFFIDRNFKSISGQTLGVILGCSIAGVAFGILYLLSPRKQKKRRTVVDIAEEQRRQEVIKDRDRTVAAYQESKQVRMAELAADPNKSKYLELMKRGEWWTDEQIAYYENPAMTATCAHLQPIERAMRSRGIDLRLVMPPWEKFVAIPMKVKGDCCINEAELWRQFAVPECVEHKTGYQPERSEFDNPWAALVCSSCASSIDLVHPEWPRKSTAWFPVAPGQTNSA